MGVAPRESGRRLWFLYTDNDSKFRLTLYQRSRFYTYRDETLEGLVETEVGRALRDL